MAQLYRIMDMRVPYVHLNEQKVAKLPRTRSYSRVTRQALTMLGKLIRIGRAERGLTAQELADRAGISRTTLSSIEKGAPGPEIGIVFEVASLVGVRLFDYDERTLRMQNARLDEKLTLLPKSVRHAVKEVDDDF
ncbi:DNA-binding XRE family transcriptional regulator [Sinorhizobium medicae]